MANESDRPAATGRKRRSRSAEATRQPSQTMDGGVPLPAATRAHFEAQLGHDLASTRVHRGKEAELLAMAAGGNAFAMENHVWLRPGVATAPNPTLAHELTHVAQWHQGASSRLRADIFEDSLQEQLTPQHFDGVDVETIERLLGAMRAYIGNFAPGSTDHDALEQNIAMATQVLGTRTTSEPAAPAPNESTPRPRQSQAARPTSAPAAPRGPGGRSGRERRVFRDLSALSLYDPREFSTFLAANEGRFYEFLAPYGYHGSFVDPARNVADFQNALMAYARANGLPRLTRAQDAAIADRRQTEWEDHQNEDIAAMLPNGQGYIGPRRGFDAATRRLRAQRALRTGNNIRNGLFGAIGYGIGGDAGSDMGAAFDGLATAAGGVAQARANNRALSSTPAPRQGMVDMRQAPGGSAAPTRPLRPGRQTSGRKPAGPEVFGELSRELRMEAPGTVPHRGVGDSAKHAQRAGWVDANGQATGGVGAVVQSHGSATAVRNAFGISGRQFESAHLAPTSFLRDVAGYSRSRADTVLLDRATHRAFDRHWKQWAQQQRRDGRTTCTVSELYNVMVDAIGQPQLPLSQHTRNTIVWRMQLELTRDHQLQWDSTLTLPYANIGPQR